MRGRIGLRNLEQIMARLGSEGFQAPIVKDQKLNGREALETASGAAIAMSEGKFIKKLGCADVED